LYCVHIYSKATIGISTLGGTRIGLVQACFDKKYLNSNDIINYLLSSQGMGCSAIKPWDMNLFVCLLICLIEAMYLRLTPNLCVGG
jgi:hypothetical protein